MKIPKFTREFDYRSQYEELVEEAAEFIRPHLSVTPEFALTLGSGLGDLASAISTEAVIDYADIPFFPKPTVEGHEGRLHIGKLSGVPIIGLQGRKHYYEVADQPDGMLQVVFPVHVMANLGVSTYFGSNAVGSLDHKDKPGNVMVVRDHINYIPNPLLGREMDFARIDGSPVLRFQPMNEAYNDELSDMLLRADKSESFSTEGTYLALTGPTYETAGEVKAFRSQGADTVGMSLAPEVIVATNRGMNTLGLNVITNVMASDGTNATSHEEVVNVLNSQEHKDRLTDFVTNFFEAYRDLEFRLALRR